MLRKLYRVDRQRGDAEDEACRGRDKIRKLTEILN